jgi:glycosyltransferase involved in cell wall biosynthesis
MPRICFLTPMHPSRNPRLLRSASRLVQEGHAVDVIYPKIQPEFVKLDSELASTGGWTSRPINLIDGVGAKLRWQSVRWRRRLAAELTRVTLNERLVSWSVNYVAPEMVRAARASKADLFIAQQHPTVPAAARSAQSLGKPFAIDVEDMLSDSDDEPRRVMRRIEASEFPRAAFFYSMSDAAVARTRQLSGSPAPGFVVHNTPSLAERRALKPPRERPAQDLPTIYWFGQTLGPHSCGLNILEAIGRSQRPVRLALRGNPHAAYVAELQSRAASLGLSDRLQILPPAHPEEMVTLCADHAICLGSQPTAQLFHQLAIGNKVFTGMMAGCALLLTNTIAHRRLVEEASECATLYDEGDPGGLAGALEPWLREPEKLLAARQRAWELATTRYNWERESKQLVSAVQQALR